jgi:hypothetical protein
MLLLAALLATATAAPPEPACRTAYGQTACGYDCVAAYGQVKCAATPNETCHAAYGQVACGPVAPAFAPAALTWPKAECVSAYGKIACGYGCVVGYGEVGCATTPWGACVAAYGSITCASGDASLVQAARWGTEIPRATCVTAFGQRACGWSCAASRGVTVCATTPWSACDVALDGRPVCSDPPPLAAPPAP